MLKAVALVQREVEWIVAWDRTSAVLLLLARMFPLCSVLQARLLLAGTAKESRVPILDPAILLAAAALISSVSSLVWAFRRKA